MPIMEEVSSCYILRTGILTITVCGTLKIVDAQSHKSDYAELLSLGCNTEERESASSLAGISVKQRIFESKVSCITVHLSRVVSV